MIEIIEPKEPDQIYMRDMIYGSYAVSGGSVVFRCWAGVVSLACIDDKFHREVAAFWPSETLNTNTLKVTPLPKGIKILITVEV